LQAQGFDQHDADEKYATELVKVGETAPDFKLKTPDGKALKLSKLQKGRWTVIDFWASWCPDCRKDIPSVKRMYEDFAQKGVQFVGVSFDTDNEVWKNAIAKLISEWTVKSSFALMVFSIPGRLWYLFRR
jgi:thiol-disulfide isomerase/thioredoxin